MESQTAHLLTGDHAVPCSWWSIAECTAQCEVVSSFSAKSLLCKHVEETLIQEPATLPVSEEEGKGSKLRLAGSASFPDLAALQSHLLCPADAAAGRARSNLLDKQVEMTEGAAQQMTKPGSSP